MQDIDDVPEDLRRVYRTGWELDPTVLVDMARDRAPYIDQSQSMSLFVAEPSAAVLVR